MKDNLVASLETTLADDQVLLITKALADPRRYEILKHIGECDHTLSCETMRSFCDISPATLSHHMKELILAGLVESERKGKFVHYALRRNVLEAYFSRLRSDLL